MVFEIIHIAVAVVSIANAGLISWIIYEKTSSKNAIIKAIKAEKKEKLNLDYAEKIIIATGEVQSNINDLLIHNLSAGQKILDELEKKTSRNSKKKEIEQIIAQMYNNSIECYHSIFGFYRLVEIDNNINGVNKEINSEVENIKEIVDEIENIFNEVDASANSDIIETQMRDMIGKYNTSKELERQLKDSIVSIIRACKKRML